MTQTIKLQSIPKEDSPASSASSGITSGVHRYPVTDIKCGVFSLRRGTLCFTPDSDTPVLQLRYEIRGDRSECFFLYEARVRQISPDGKIGLTSREIKPGALLTPTSPTKKNHFTPLPSLEDSHHPLASTLTLPQLQDIEWTMTIHPTTSLYSIKLHGDRCNNWITTTLREYNYHATCMPSDPAFILFTPLNTEKPETRYFGISDVYDSTDEVKMEVKKWVVMDGYQGSYNVPEIPKARPLWMIPRRYHGHSRSTSDDLKKKGDEEIPAAGQDTWWVQPENEQVESISVTGSGVPWGDKPGSEEELEEGEEELEEGEIREGKKKKKKRDRETTPMEREMTPHEIAEDTQKRMAEIRRNSVTEEIERTNSRREKTPKNPPEKKQRKQQQQKQKQKTPEARSRRNSKLQDVLEDKNEKAS
ncbi:hypothetical protein TWF481_007447 [Arthrobotrys musiformis]|uniref:Uncharacterized protein n=1 Tax=Arthrobotrys musiformis TaxID=47236 RepID=A0AAV9WBP0_9PEZI